MYAMIIAITHTENAFLQKDSNRVSLGLAFSLGELIFL